MTHRNTNRRTPARGTPTRLRIVAGRLGGRKIEYNGDPDTRPMKERTRESLFSLLGGYLDGTIAIDLFGGTGILTFEAISRGAEWGLILEYSRIALSTIKQNRAALDLEDEIDVQNVDTLRWFKSLDSSSQRWPQLPWILFCCPPYRMWKTDLDRLVGGIRELYRLAPEGSVIACEMEQDFDIQVAVPEIDWDVRHYTPAHLAIAEK